MGTWLYPQKAPTFFVLVLVLIASLIGIHIKRERLALFAWDTFQSRFIVNILDSHNAALYETIGNYYFQGDHYDIEKAKGYFTKALVFNDRLPLAHYQLARIYFISGDFPKALQEADTQLALYPEYKRSYYLRGLIYGYSHNLDDAITDFKAFLAWKPESWAAHNDLAWVYFRQGDFRDAEKYAREGLRYTPTSPWLANSLGTVLLNLGRYKEAETYLLQAKTSFASMSPEDWGRAYPGNNPRIYTEGLLASRKSVDANLALVQQKLAGE